MIVASSFETPAFAKASAGSSGSGRKSVQQNQALPCHSVMPGLVPGIHVFRASARKHVDGRNKPGHDEKWIHFQDATQALKLLDAFRPDSLDEGIEPVTSK